MPVSLLKPGHTHIVNDFFLNGTNKIQYVAVM